MPAMQLAVMVSGLRTMDGLVFGGFHRKRCTHWHTKKKMMYFIYIYMNDVFPPSFQVYNCSI